MTKTYHCQPPKSALKKKCDKKVEFVCISYPDSPVFLCDIDVVSHYNHKEDIITIERFMQLDKEQKLMIN